MRPLKAGDWYLGVDCAKCGVDIPLFNDPSSGKAHVMGPGQIAVECPACGHQQNYPTTALKNRQAGLSFQVARNNPPEDK